MKNNFKKLMSIALVVVMLGTLFCVSASAATYTVTLKGGTRTLNGVKYTATLNETLLNLPGNTYTDANGAVYTIDKENHTVTFTTDSTGYVTFPEMFFVMEGHTQSAWGTSSTSNGSTTYKEGRRLKITGAKTYYPRFDTVKYTAEFLPGADGIGTAETVDNKTYGASVTLPDAIFTRTGHVQIGWAFTENAETVEYALGDKTFKIFADTKFYPVWQKVEYSVQQSLTRVTFGSICEDYVAPEAQEFTITNNSNSDVTFAIPSSVAFNIVATSTTIDRNGGTVVITIQPKVDLDVASYNETLVFDFGIPEIKVTLSAKFVVNAHLFVEYVSDGNASYSADGTETATCFLGCGAEDNRVAVGSKKIYSVDNNEVIGLLGEYLYHKSVKFTVYGSGMDDAEGIIGKRFRPVSWYVNDTFNGEFAADATSYEVKYDHGDGNFGTYTLEVKYVEEEKDANGEWVATGIEDVKTYEYSIGPSEKDNQEVVRPNMIVSIIFALFGYLIDLIGSGSLF